MSTPVAKSQNNVVAYYDNVHAFPLFINVNKCN